jgi:minor extracellular serine protease Vpr
VKQTQRAITLALAIYLLFATFAAPFTARAMSLPSAPSSQWQRPVASPSLAPVQQTGNGDGEELPPNVILPGRIERTIGRDKQMRIMAETDLDPEVALLAAAGDRMLPTLIDVDMPALGIVAPSMTPEERLAYAAQVAALQDEIIAEIEAAGGEVIGRLKTLSSGVLASIPGYSAPQLSQHPRVRSVSLVYDYLLDLGETVPEIGADVLHIAGLTGEGVNVAVIDSGVDYTHVSLGGTGTITYELAYTGTNKLACASYILSCAHSQITPLFPFTNTKVVGGWDFVGELWPYGPRYEDSNPIDFQGHGTSVADIIAGCGPDGDCTDDNYPSGVGVAPKARIWAFRACAALSTACNGIATLLSLDDAADMDDNLATFDPVDIVNLSLGGGYGQPEDDASALINVLASMGVIVVVSAGNDGAPPYIVGQPSTADGALSVAQTSVPSLKRYQLYALQPESIEGELVSAHFQTWSISPEETGVITGTLVYGNGDGTNLLGCSEFDVDLTGQVVLMDRGDCNFTLKAKHASEAGAILALIGMVDNSLPFAGADGGDGPITLPAFMISKADADRLRTGLAEGETVVELNPANFVPLFKTIVDTSSRGPRINDSRIKPEIGAPGASFAAVARSGDKTAPFGGTSGAAPMVSGVAALLKEYYGDSLTVYQYKALLMNNANSHIHMFDPATGQKGELAPITRIGAGQVDANASYNATLIAWDSTDDDPVSWGGALSFGYVPVSETITLSRTLTVLNLDNAPVDVVITPTFRFANDEDAGVQITVQPADSNQIPGGETRDFYVQLQLTPASLKPWAINMGELGNDGEAFTNQEYDGFIEIGPSGGGSSIHVPWHVLPKRAAGMELAALPASGGLSGSGSLINHSTQVNGTTQVFDLIDRSPNNFDYTIGPCPVLVDISYCDITAIDLKEIGVRTSEEDDELILEFAITLWDKPYRAAQYPVSLEVYIDSNGDFEDDYVLYTADLTYLSDTLDGRSYVWIYNENTNTFEPSLAVVADFNTQNFILRVPAADVGVEDGEEIHFAVGAYDAYFTGQLTDCSPAVENFCLDYHTYTVGKPAFVADQRTLNTEPEAITNYTYQWSVDGANSSPSQIGLLFLHEAATVGRESDAVVLTPPTAEIAVSKVASVSTADVGQTITYHYFITNTGTLTATDVTAVDNKLGQLTLDTTILGPGASTYASVDYKVLAADYPGPLVNTVIVTARPLAGEEIEVTDTVSVALTLPPVGLAVSKTANVSVAEIGQEIVYHYAITNTGQLALTGIFANDDKLGQITLPTTTLAPGQSTSAEARYTPTLADLPGPLVNSVTVNATPEVGTMLQASDSASVNLIQPEIGITVKKTPSVNVVNVGGQVSYAYEITNIGQMPLTSVTAVDDKLGPINLSQSTPDIALPPGASIEVHKSYTVTRDDLPGPLVNIVTVLATPSSSPRARLFRSPMAAWSLSRASASKASNRRVQGKSTAWCPLARPWSTAILFKMWGKRPSPTIHLWTAT